MSKSRLLDHPVLRILAKEIGILEHLVTAKRLADSATLVARKEAWADAYRSTPHGMPVKLATGSDG